VLNVVQAVLPQFRARRGGHILVVGSMSAHVSFPTMTVYASSKAAVRSLVEGLQMECEPLGVKITLVEPAGYMTKFFDNIKTAERIDAYDDTYARMQTIFDNSHFGNIPKSLGAVADITGIRDQHRRAEVGARYPGRPTRRIRQVGRHHQRNRLTSRQVSHGGGIRTTRRCDHALAKTVTQGMRNRGDAVQLSIIRCGRCAAAVSSAPPSLIPPKAPDCDATCRWTLSR
jgi:hypothetical protein